MLAEKATKEAMQAADEAWAEAAATLTAEVKYDADPATEAASVGEEATALVALGSGV